MFYGWYVVGASLLIAFYTSGVVYHGFTAVIEPVVKEFGWSYAQISLAASLRGLEIGLLAPLVGILVDRWGPRRLVFGGGIFVGLGFLVLSRVSSLATFYGAFALIAIGMSTCAQTVLVTAVANWFHRKAGVAIGIMASGIGLGGLLVPVVTKLIDVLQWRTAMFILGLGVFVFVLPLSLFMRHKPEQHGYLLDGENGIVQVNKTRVSMAHSEVNISVRQAIKNKTFWILAIGSMCHMFVLNAIVTHIMPYLSSVGFTRSFSSMVALALAVSSIGGRLSSGWLDDKFGNRRMYIASYISMTIGLLLLSFLEAGRTWLLVPFIIIFSLGWGWGVTTRFSLQREYFGRGSFGTILGFLSGIMMIGNITGAPIAGWIYDTWGSYKGAWLGFCSLSITAVIMAFLIPSSNRTMRKSDRAANR